MPQKPSRTFNVSLNAVKGGALLALADAPLHPRQKRAVASLIAREILPEGKVKIVVEGSFTRRAARSVAEEYTPQVEQRAELVKRVCGSLSIQKKNYAFEFIRRLSQANFSLQQIADLASSARDALDARLKHAGEGDAVKGFFRDFYASVGSTSSKKFMQAAKTFVHAAPHASFSDFFREYVRLRALSRYKNAAAAAGLVAEYYSPAEVSLPPTAPELFAERPKVSVPAYARLRSQHASRLKKPPQDFLLAVRLFETEGRVGELLETLRRHDVSLPAYMDSYANARKAAASRQENRFTLTLPDFIEKTRVLHPPQVIETIKLGVEPSSAEEYETLKQTMALLPGRRAPEVFSLVRAYSEYLTAAADSRAKSLTLACYLEAEERGVPREFIQRRLEERVFEEGKPIKTGYILFHHRIEKAARRRGLTISHPVLRDLFYPRVASVEEALAAHSLNDFLESRLPPARRNDAVYLARALSQALPHRALTASRTTAFWTKLDAATAAQIERRLYGIDSNAAALWARLVETPAKRKPVQPTDAAASVTPITPITVVREAPPQRTWEHLKINVGPLLPAEQKHLATAVNIILRLLANPSKSEVSAYHAALPFDKLRARCVSRGPSLQDFKRAYKFLEDNGVVGAGGHNLAGVSYGARKEKITLLGERIVEHVETLRGEAAGRK